MAGRSPTAGGEALTLVLVLGLAGGCALTNATLRIAHAGLGEAGPRASSEPVVQMGTVHDARQEQRREGVKQNGFAWATASVFTTTEPREIVRSAPIADLRDAGFHLHQGVASPGLPVIDIKLTQFFVDPQLTWFGAVTV